MSEKSLSTPSAPIEGTVRLVTEKPLSSDFQYFLSAQALEFLVALHQKFEPVRQALLDRREVTQKAIDAGQMPTFPKETQAIRKDATWQVAPIPADLQDRRVEITGPVERKMMINALNSGAKIFMADFEDANSPTWENALQGQRNCYDAIRKQIDFYDEKKDKHYKLNAETAVLLVRPRGWHLSEKHLLIDGVPISGSLFDFGLYVFHNTQEMLKRGTAPYFYLPKLENHLEARLWNDVFVFAQNYLAIPIGTFKATVLLETILAAFEIEEILYELREHIVGINAGRWDYIFSAIKKFRNVVQQPLPDRAQITMTVPFMRAYTELLVHFCHKRGAHAIGGMSAFIPTKNDANINAKAFEQVRKDKEREAADGFDGSWVAHPDLVPIAKAVFDAKFGDKPHQKERLRNDVVVEKMETQLLDFQIEGGKITDSGIRLNISVALRYVSAWLNGVGAAAIFNLMEDAATAEISRTQLWQWLFHPKAQRYQAEENGEAAYFPITAAYLKSCFEEEYQKIVTELGETQSLALRYPEAREILEKLVFSPDYQDFLTTSAYERL
ncbi:malate synthase A [Hugenholtzia roseola]|uniref:malate synthase A n=1 Tax=Hugenholtzia roseola TaxID=1002 RepID=UPI00040E422B|nr:malate synthase A [Hugenholtzia roseola]